MAGPSRHPTPDVINVSLFAENRRSRGVWQTPTTNMANTQLTLRRLLRAQGQLLGRGHHAASHSLCLGWSAAGLVALCPQACPRHHPQGLDKSSLGTSDFIPSPPLGGCKVGSRRLSCPLPWLHISRPSPPRARSHPLRQNRISDLGFTPFKCEGALTGRTPTDYTLCPPTTL